MYQIVAAQSKYSEEEVRDRLSTVYPDWDIEGMDLSDRGWLVRLKKNAEFPFDEDEKDDSDSDSPKDSEDSDDSDSKDDSDSEDKPKDAEDDSDDDSDIDVSDGLDEGEAKDLVGQLNELQGQLNKLVEELGGKAQEVAEDAKAKDDKIKEIADSVNEVAPKDEMLGDMAGLDDVGLGAELPGGAAKGGPPRPPRGPRPPAAPKKRPPVPGGGINTFTKRKVEILTHPGTDHTGAKISMLVAAREIEAVDQWKDYEIMSMTQNVDGSFSAKLRLK